MANLGILTIATEADAWLLLEKTIKTGKLPIDAEVIRLEIGPWPVLHLKVEGDKFQSSVTTRMMTAFLDLQKNIYRTYAKMQYDLANGRVLSNEEKAALELVVVVHPGSSEYIANLTELAKTLVKGAINKMDGKHFVIIGVVGLLAWTSSSVINGYISSQVEQKKIEAQITLSKEETRRLELMKEATKQVPYAGISVDLAEEVVNKILKGASNAKSITIGGHTFNREQVSKLIRPERSTSKEIRLDGEYRILKVDSSNVDYFKVELLSTDYKRFWAVLQDATVTKEKNKELLQDAEWSKKPINLVVNGREVKGEITTASIIDVKDRYLGKK